MDHMAESSVPAKALANTLILIFKVVLMCIASIVISETAIVNGYVVHLLAANDVLNTSIDGKSVLSGC